MTKRYKTLQKKLQELEAKLSLVFSVPATTTTTPRHHLNPECIQQRFTFLKNLLSAEIASRPSKPRHLRHIGKRITDLEIAFHDHQECSVAAAGDCSTDINYNNKLDTRLLTTSKCSCDESSLEDDGEAAVTATASSGLTSPELGSSEDELLVQQNNSPRALVKLKVQKNGGDSISSSDDNVEVQCHDNSVNVELDSSEQEIHQQNEDYNVEKKERRISYAGKYCGALIVGTILGMILMGAAIVKIWDCDSLDSPPQQEGYTFYT